MSGGESPQVLGERLMQRVRAAGAEHAVAWVRQVDAVDGVLDGWQTITERVGRTQTVTLQVARAGRLGSAIGNGTGEAAEQRIVAAALAAAADGGPVDFGAWELPAPVRASGGAVGAALPVDDRRELLLAAWGADESGGAERGFAGAPLGIEYQEERVTTACASTSGCAVEFSASHRRLWQWADGPGGNFLEGDRSWGDRLPNPARLRAEWTEVMAVRQGGELTGSLGAADTVMVLLAPAVAVHIVSALAGMLNGVAVTGTLTPLRGRVGNRIASPAVTLIDDGRLGAGPDGALLDAEGTPTARNVLLERGVLRGFLHLRRTAKACGVPANGGAVARPGATARPGPRGLRLETGTSDRAELRRELATGFEAVAALGPGRVRGTKGEFAIDVLGWEVRGGERVRPVGPVTLRCGLFAFLRGVLACGDSLHQSAIFHGVAAPAVLLQAASLAGTR